MKKRAKKRERERERKKNNDSRCVLLAVVGIRANDRQQNNLSHSQLPIAIQSQLKKNFSDATEKGRKNEQVHNVEVD